MLTEKRFPKNLPAGWQERLASEIQKPYFAELSRFLTHEYQSGVTVFPPQDKILRALQEVDYDKVKIVILGQDPYHGDGQAVGLSFAVPNSLMPKPPSLKNIFKEIESDVSVKVHPQHSELSSWANQGVLLLNTVLTVRRSQAFSHRDKGWECFTDHIITLLNERLDPVIFILWGAPARQKKKLISKPHHKVLEAAHPSPLAAHKGFFGCRHFSKANDYLKHWGKAPIDWAKTQ